MANVDFRKMTIDYLPLYYAWAEKDHVKNTWFLDGYASVDSIKETIEGNGYDYSLLILLDDKAIGYLQYCDLFAYRNICLDPKPLYKNEPEGTMCMDLFIGEDEYLNKGYGTSIVKKFCEFLFSQSGVQRILIDPSVDNLRAIRCYEKAGFKKIKEAFDGVTTIQFMEKLR